MADLRVIAAQTTIQAPQLPIDPDTKVITYKEVVSQEGASDQLFDRGISWLRIFYLSPSSVFNVMDKDNRKLEGIGRLKIIWFDKRQRAP